MEVDETNKEDGENLEEIVSMQSEASILQKASEEIKKFADAKAARKNADKEVDDKPKEVEKTVSDEGSILRAKLQDQVRTGEITPFQAAKKESVNKIILGRTFKESTQLLDIEKYLYRQAELARLKKLAKKNKNKEAGKEREDDPPAKKLKLSKSKLDDQKSENKSSKKRQKSEKKSLKSNEDCQNASFQADSNFPENYVVEDKEVNLDNNMESPTETSNTLIHEQIYKAKRTFDVPEDEDLESGSEYVPTDDDYDSDEEKPKKSERKKKIGGSKQSNSMRPTRVLDDGDEEMYKQRVRESNYKKNKILYKVDDLLKIPVQIWKELFKYQRVSVKWLWELHTRSLGGLLGDEMGLGKTVQVIAFLAGLDCSELLTDGGRFRGLGPTLIVCPATLLEQWVKHFHDWYPVLRIVMLHHSSTFEGDVDELLHTLKSGGILVVSYTGVLLHRESILKYKWHYVILDEGHKIRNPEAKVTKAMKTVLTPHRLLLTGSPMQNSLKELWSLFDFILPGKLGTLAAFMEHCAGPITRGGYSNASRLQEETALQVATMLKDAITPYMLRRTKYDVQHHVNLPDKNEQVLFCSLTEDQRQLYKQYLRSDDVSYIVHDRNEGGRYRARLLVALTALRKICNHPDLFLYADEQQNQTESGEEDDLEIDENAIEKFGHWKRSGKMTVVRSLLKIWKKQGHRVLLFTQSRQMMHVLEGLVQKENYSYLRMDGTTPMNQRQYIISKFNKDPSFFVFLLTTRVGGLGVNLTGADRVIIYDPDWNPATDAQARERAWRIGQDKNVTIYRLITAGTIEEKMYHRQVFKILLSNRVLEDPRQRRLFRTTDLTELFNLNEPIPGGSSESDQLFRTSKLTPGQSTATKSSSSKPAPVQSNFSADKIEAMKKLAAELSKKIGETVKSSKSTESNIEKTCKDEGKSKNPESPSSKVQDVVEPEPVDNSTDDKQSENDKTETSVNNEENSLDVDMNEELETKVVNDKPEHNDTVIDAKGRSEHVEEKVVEDVNVDLHDIEEGEIVGAEPKEAMKEDKIVKKKSSNSKCNEAVKDAKVHKSHKKQKKHKKSKSDDTVSAMFEGERVSCLLGRRLGTSNEPKKVAAEDDEYVLSKLFSKSAVSSAFQHESVLASAGYGPDDQTPLQRAAKETASEKMDCIRQSRKWCWKPSWDRPPEEEEDYESGSDESECESDD